jgi:hypothetical protein
LKYILFIFILVFQLKATVYILTYKIVISNSIVRSESLTISTPMLPVKDLKLKRVSSWFSLEAKKKDSDKDIIQLNREKILNILFREGILINSFSNNTSSRNSETITLMLPPIYIAIVGLYQERYFSILKND